LSMSFESTLQTQIETAITAVVTAIADGDIVVEYEIGGRRVRRADKTKALTDLYELRRTVATDAQRQSKSLVRVARLSRASGIGTS